MTSPIPSTVASKLTTVASQMKTQGYRFDGLGFVKIDCAPHGGKWKELVLRTDAESAITRLQAELDETRAALKLAGSTLKRMVDEEIANPRAAAIAIAEKRAETLETALKGLLDHIHAGRFVPDSTSSEGVCNSLVVAGELALYPDEGGRVACPPRAITSNTGG